MPLKTYQKNKKIIAGIIGVTPKTIGNHLDRLAEKGLIDEGIETLNGKDVPVLWFPPVEGRFEIIEQDMVRYLVDTSSINAIKIYIYLLNKYKWKRQTDDRYIFTEKELLLAIGYSENTEKSELYTTIRNILKSLTISGLIKYKKVQCEIKDCDTYKTTERMELVYVVEKFSEVEELYKNKMNKNACL